MSLHESVYTPKLETFRYAYEQYVVQNEVLSIESTEADCVLRFFAEAARGTHYKNFDLEEDGDRLARFTVKLGLAPVDEEAIARSISERANIKHGDIDQIFFQPEVTQNRGSLTRQIIPYGDMPQTPSGFIIVHFSEISNQ